MKKINALSQILGGFTHTHSFKPAATLVDYVLNPESFSFHGPDGSRITLTSTNVFDSMGKTIDKQHPLYQIYGFRVSRQIVINAAEQTNTRDMRYTATVSWN